MDLSEKTLAKIAQGYPAWLAQQSDDVLDEKRRAWEAMDGDDAAARLAEVEAEIAGRYYTTQAEG
jgi:hypothetical protein